MMDDFISDKKMTMAIDASKPERKIKVLQGIRQGKIGGGESILLSLVEMMNKEIFKPVVLSFTDGPMVDKLRSLNIPVYVIYTEKAFDVSVWNKVKKLMHDEQIDVVHAHGTRACSNMFWAAKKVGLPFIYTCHGWSFHQDQNGLKRMARIWGEKVLTRQTAVNICVSYANRDLGKKVFGRQFQSVVIRNAVDGRRFDPDKAYKDIRKEFKVAPSELLFTAVARFTWQKQPLVLIRSFTEAAAVVENIRLLMVGDGEERPQAIEWVASHGMKDKIALEPFRQDVPDILAAADVFVLPSLWEGLPVALLEAMSMRKAIIASNVDGTVEVIDNGIDGILIDTDHLQRNLTDAIIRLSRDEKLRNTIAYHAGEKIKDEYSINEMARKNEEVYLNLSRETLLRKNIS